MSVWEGVAKSRVYHDVSPASDHNFVNLRSLPRKIQNAKENVSRQRWRGPGHLRVPRFSGPSGVQSSRALWQGGRQGGKEREREGRKGKGRKGKEREGKGRKGKGREGKGRKREANPIAMASKLVAMLEDRERERERDTKQEMGYETESTSSYLRKCLLFDSLYLFFCSVHVTGLLYLATSGWFNKGGHCLINSSLPRNQRSQPPSPPPHHRHQRRPRSAALRGAGEEEDLISRG